MRTHTAKTTSRQVKAPPYSPEKRGEMIAEAAYYRAEHRSFCGGDMIADWVEAEAEIDHMLQAAPGNEVRSSAKRAFQQGLESQFKEWDRKLAELRKQAPEMKGKIRAEYEKQLELVEGKRTQANEKLLELRKRTEDAWEDLKEGAEKAWADMREAMEQLASRFK